MMNHSHALPCCGTIGDDSFHGIFLLNNFRFLMFNYVWRRSSLDINDYYLIEDRLLRALPLLVWFQQELTYPVLRAFLFDEFLYISNNMFYYIVLNQGFFLLSNVTLKFQAFFTLTGTSLLAMYTDRQLEISLLMTKNSIMCVSSFLQNNMYLHIFFLFLAMC